MIAGGTTNKMSGGKPDSLWKTATATAASEMFTRIKLNRVIIQGSGDDAGNTRAIVWLRV
jgi:hypothetical protein